MINKNKNRSIEELTQHHANLFLAYEKHSRILKEKCAAIMAYDEATRPDFIGMSEEERFDIQYSRMRFFDNEIASAFATYDTAMTLATGERHNTFGESEDD